MNERDKILHRIQQALSVPSPRPGHGTGSVILPKTQTSSVQSWLPPTGQDQEAWESQFARNCSELKTEIISCDDDGETALKELAKANHWQRVAAHDSTSAVAAKLALPCLISDQGYEASELEQCDAGITTCEALIAQTGSILLTSATSGGRALSVLPAHHVVLARREQLLPDLSAAYSQLVQRYAPDQWPSFITFITGPSRTGDIERILVLGAHGPKRLTILLTKEF